MQALPWHVSCVWLEVLSPTAKLGSPGSPRLKASAQLGALAALTCSWLQLFGSEIYSSLTAEQQWMLDNSENHLLLLAKSQACLRDY